MAKPDIEINKHYYSGFAGNLRVGIVVSVFNREITDLLLQGAIGCLTECGIQKEQMIVLKVPGAFEIPKACDWLCRKKNTDGIVTLGAVIRGETPHFDYVCSESARGIAELNLKYEIPLSYGILTCNSREQALERAGGSYGNKGAHAARAMLDMIKIRHEL